MRCGSVQESELCSAGVGGKHPPPPAAPARKPGRRRALPGSSARSSSGPRLLAPLRLLAKRPDAQGAALSSTVPTESQPRREAAVLTPGEEGPRVLTPGEEGPRGSNPPAGRQAQPLRRLPAPLPGSQTVQPWDSVLLISPGTANGSGEQ